jgi:small-conductance mechanosensitive channel
MVKMIMDALSEAWGHLLTALASFLPRLVVTLSIVVAGWIIAAVLSFLARRLLRWVRFNRFAERAGAADLLRKAELPPADALLGSLTFWLVLTGFLLSGLGANFAWRATLLAAVNSKMPAARLIAEAVRLLILVLTAAMALERVGVAQTVVLTAFAIAFGAVMLGGAIAFGIGGGPIARRILEQRFPEQERKNGDGASHL